MGAGGPRPSARPHHLGSGCSCPQSCLAWPDRCETPPSSLADGPHSSRVSHRVSGADHRIVKELCRVSRFALLPVSNFPAFPHTPANSRQAGASRKSEQVHPLHGGEFPGRTASRAVSGISRHYGSLGIRLGEPRDTNMSPQSLPSASSPSPFCFWYYRFM